MASRTLGLHHSIPVANPAEAHRDRLLIPLDWIADPGPPSWFRTHEKELGFRFPPTCVLLCFPPARLHRPSSARFKVNRPDLRITTLVPTRPVACLTTTAPVFYLRWDKTDRQNKIELGLSWIGGVAHDQSLLTTHSRPSTTQQFSEHDGTISPNGARSAGSRHGSDLCSPPRSADCVGIASHKSYIPH